MSPDEVKEDLDALKAEADVAGQTVHGVAVQGAVGNFAQPLDQPVPHGGDSGHVLVHVVAGFLQCLSLIHI